MARIWIGTSGWSYDHWRGGFYPEDIRAQELLPWYGERFETVEINRTFYKLPSKATLQTWRDQSPASFLFAAKASRYLTHMRKLKEPKEPLARLFGCIEVLGRKLGPVLFQLPPRWRANPDRLAAFLDQLPLGHRYAFEFRDPSWHCDRVLELLSGRGAAFCIYDLAGERSPLEVTADFVYVRLHGPGGAYQGSYDGRTLSGWARRFVDWGGQGRDVYGYFDNDEKGYAPEDAARLKAMIEKRT